VTPLWADSAAGKRALHGFSVRAGAGEGVACYKNGDGVRFPKAGGHMRGKLIVVRLIVAFLVAVAPVMAVAPMGTATPTLGSQSSSSPTDPAS
jgi:hypothetical protein